MNVVITGTNFTGATSVSFGAGITVTAFTVDSPTQITAIISIAETAALGPRDVSVTSPYGTGTLLNGFTVVTPSVPRSPTVETLPPTSISGVRATLNGYLVDDEDWRCDVWFEWGGSTAYGMQTPVQTGKATGDTFSDVVSGLRPGGAYHFRAVATSRSGYRVHGRDMEILTLEQGHILTLVDQTLLGALEA